MIGQHIVRLRPTYYGDHLKQDVRQAVAAQEFWMGKSAACTRMATCSRSA